jgi:GrpB-like predicted nucleotidyltransferase (UPF0157 family)
MAGRLVALAMITPPRKPVIVVPYDPSWPERFAQFHSVYARVLDGVATAIEHVGSTAVPGLHAKPIIDIDVVIPSTELLPEVTRRLGTLGYSHGGNAGVPSRESFDCDSPDVPRDGSGRQWSLHNLYVCAVGARELGRHLAFRDWLRAHPDDAAEYGQLKQRLAEQFRHDREAYVDGKSALVERVLAQAATAQARR